MAVGSDYVGKPVNVGDFCTIIGGVSSVSGNNIIVKCANSGTLITVPFQGSTTASSNIDSARLSGAGKTQNPATDLFAGEQVSVKGTVSSVGSGGFTALVNVLLADAVTTVTVNAGDVYNSLNS